MSFTFNKKSKDVRPFVKSIGGEYNNNIVSIDTNITPNNNNFKFLKLEQNINFQCIPDSSKEREIYYITAPSGSGKSYFVMQYVKEYQRKFKNNPIYLFSNVREDPTIDKINNLKRFKIDKSLVDDPLDIKDLENSCVIFDDCDTIVKKDIRQAVIGVLNSILEEGRHWAISCLITYHLPSNGHDTKRMLNEAQKIVYFPNSSSSKIKYVLQNYLDIDEKQIKEFKRINTRWVVISKNYPMCYATQHQIGILNQDSDED